MSIGIELIGTGSADAVSGITTIPATAIHAKGCQAIRVLPPSLCTRASPRPRMQTVAHGHAPGWERLQGLLLLLLRAETRKQSCRDTVTRGVDL